MPSAVGSGCRQMRVATGGRSSGTASSPTRVSPSAVCSSMSVRRAGSTVLARISGILVLSVARAATGPLDVGHAIQPMFPAGAMPVAPVLRATTLGRPRDDVPDPRRDLLITSGAAVGLRGTGGGPYDPVAVGPFFDPLRTAERTTPGFPWHVACAAILSRTHADQGKGCAGHARQRK